MQLTVTYMAQLKAASGTPTECIELETGSTVRDLVTQIVQAHGDGLRKLLLDEKGDLRRSILLFQGEESLAWDDPRELSHGKEITILSPVAGG